MNRNTDRLAFLVIAVAALVACASDESGPTADGVTTTIAEPDAEPGGAGPGDVEPDPGSVEPPTTNDSIATSEPIVESRWLASVIIDGRGQHGWLVPAGTWTTSAFESPLTFTTSSDLILVGEYRDAVVFRSDDASPHYLYIARAAFIKESGDSVPAPATAEEITSLIERLPFVELAATGRTTAGEWWWDIVVDDFSDGAPYGCELGDACGPIGFARDRLSIDAIEGEVSRIHRTDIDGDRVGVYVTGPTDGREPMLAVAEEIVDSLSNGAPAATPPEESFFGLLGATGRSMPPGTYVARYPDATLTFQVDESLDGVNVALNKVNTIWITVGSAGLGLLPANRLIDPAADQLEMRGTDQPVFTYVEPPIETTDEWLAWTTAMNGTPTVVNDETIGGLDVTFVDDAADDRTANAGPCAAGDAVGRCYTTFTSDGIDWYVALDEDGIGRGGHVEDAGLLVTIASLDGSSIDEVMAELAPLLATLVITPAA